MNRNMVRNGLLGFFCLAGFLANSCGNRQAKAPEPATGKDGLAMPVPAVSPLEDSRIGIVGGFVESLREDAFVGAAAGDSILEGQFFKTGIDGYAELILGGQAVIRLGPESELKVKRLLMTPERREIVLSLEKGTVYAKVGKLASGDTFAVRTPVSVSSVRGTEFFVRHEAERGTTLAVREGTVLCVPLSESAKWLEDTSAGNILALQAATIIATQAVRVNAGAEVVIGAPAVAKTEVALKELSGYVRDLPPSFRKGEPSVSPFEARDPGELLAAQTVPERERALLSGTAFDLSKVAVPLVLTESSAGLFKAFEVADVERLRVKRSSKGTAVPKREKSAVVTGDWKVSQTPLIGTLTQAKGMLLVVDSRGTVTAVRSDGTVSWTIATENKANNKSWPIVSKDTACLSGDAEFAVIDFATGTVKARVPSGPDRVPLQGARALQVPNGIADPETSAIAIRDAETGASLRTIPVPEGLASTPSLYGNAVAYVDMNGTFRLSDAGTGVTVGQAKTRVLGPGAISPRIFLNKACFADRNGTIVLLDLLTMTTLWERTVPGGVYTDIEFGASGIFVYSGGTIYAFDVAGNAIGAPVPDVSAPPLLSGTKLYYGLKDGLLAEADAATMKTLRTMFLDGVISARPLLVDRFVWVATSDGRLLKLDPARSDPVAVKK